MRLMKDGETLAERWGGKCERKLTVGQTCSNLDNCRSYIVQVAIDASCWSLSLFH